MNDIKIKSNGFKKHACQYYNSFNYRELYKTYVKPSNSHLLSSLIYHLLHIEKKISSIT